MSKVFTLIGSREAPEAHCMMLEEAAMRLLELGWRGRSGGARGADTALTNAVRMIMFDTQLPGDEFADIWLPYLYFNKLRPGDLGGACKYAGHSPYLRDALQLVKDVHPAWHRVQPDHRILHGRNGFQVLGETLDEPSEVVICSAPPLPDRRVKGGTATAVALAHLFHITVINLQEPNGEEELYAYINSLD